MDRLRGEKIVDIVDHSEHKARVPQRKVQLPEGRRKGGIYNPDGSRLKCRIEEGEVYGAKINGFPLMPVVADSNHVMHPIGEDDATHIRVYEMLGGRYLRPDGARQNEVRPPVNYQVPSAEPPRRKVSSVW